jgi:hypothetical protein
MRPIDLLRDAYTDDEISEYLFEIHNVIGVVVHADGVSVNRESASPDAYGWRAMPEGQLSELLRNMKISEVELAPASRRMNTTGW